MIVAIKQRKEGNMLKEFNKIYVGGEWVVANNTYEDINPSDGVKWANVADVNEEI